MSRLRIALASVSSAAFVLTACAPPAPPQSASDALFERARSDQQATEKHRAEMKARLAEQIAPSVVALKAFREEKGKPNCGSANLKRARVEALGMILGSASKQTAALYAYGVDGMITIGSAALDVADGARRAGCAKIAREIYDTTIQSFVGSAYAALRQRAEIGISDLRQARSSRP